MVTEPSNEIRSNGECRYASAKRPGQFPEQEMVLFWLSFEIETRRVAAAAERFRNSAGRDMQPGFAGFTMKAPEKGFECGGDGIEVLLPEIGPSVVVDGLIDGPLLDVRCASGCGKRGLPLRRGFLFNIVSPGLGRHHGLAVQFLHACQNGREQFAEFVIAIVTKSECCPELIGQEAGNIFKVVTKRGCGDFNLTSSERVVDLVPNLLVWGSAQIGVEIQHKAWAVPSGLSRQPGPILRVSMKW